MLEPTSPHFDCGICHILQFFELLALFIHQTMMSPNQALDSNMCEQFHERMNVNSYDTLALLATCNQRAYFATRQVNCSSSEITTTTLRQIHGKNVHVINSIILLCR